MGTHETVESKRTSKRICSYVSVPVCSLSLSGFPYLTDLN